ncbi:MAG: FkbM family methyltransferase [Bacteroidota bacterium]|jgi:hypothetical protein
MLSLFKRNIPDFIKAPINNIRNSMRWKRQFNEIINFYDNKKNLNSDEEEVIHYLKKAGGLVVFPYDYTTSWDYLSVKVYFDESIGLSYVLHNTHRLYFRRNMTEVEIKGVYFGLLNEQNKKSPHLYLTEDFSVDEGSIIVDIGAAEGIFTLSVIEKIKQAYLFETEDTWIEALNYTFKPWADKIQIINKFVSDEDRGDQITLDNFFKDTEINFIKADVEGAESKVLAGANLILSRNNNIKIAITTYHKQFDFEEFAELLGNKYGFSVQHSNGYMLFYITNNLRPPYLRRGILRASKSLS